MCVCVSRVFKVQSRGVCEKGYAKEECSLVVCRGAADDQTQNRSLCVLHDKQKDYCDQCGKCADRHVDGASMGSTKLAQA